MSKNIIVSNRLPVQINQEGDSFTITSSSGGLATGMKSVHQEGNSLWVGWSGISEEAISAPSKKILVDSLRKERYETVSLDAQEIEDFYYGLSNKSLWPLFHYFTEFSIFDNVQWESYKKVNQKFADSVLEHLEEGDKVWIHDYQLLLCPQMIKAVHPEVTIGFFLHIPFPSFEIFQIFPWRAELLNGMLGADLIGFHTYDYQRHFISSIERILRLDVNFNLINYNDREVVVNAFPMGIDYHKFETAAQRHKQLKESEKSDIQKQLDVHKNSTEDGKLILSIDRLDYTKGIVNRIKAFEFFLKRYPQYLEKVRLVMLSVPSRSNVSQYKKLKRETDEIVGRVNGSFATVNWTPIWYYYRSMAFDDLIELYTSSDVAMVTPVRDGMNLVAKEYIATRIEGDGVLILSEMAGASKEMDRALLVNPFDSDGMADALKTAIEMPVEEQKDRNAALQKRLRRYTVERWADDFMIALKEAANKKVGRVHTKINDTIASKIEMAFHSAKKRLVILDYDGTLVGFHNNPKKAIPDADLIRLLNQLCKNKATDVAIISGRSHLFLSKYFEQLPMTLIAEYGNYKRNKGEQWQKENKLNNDWMQHILPVLEAFTDRTPGTFIEEKPNCLVWHYRKADPELAQQKVVELKPILNSLISDELKIIDGNKVIEVLNGRITKGSSAMELYSKKDYDFVFAIGDDVADESMFTDLPKSAITVKVGLKATAAKYFVSGTDHVRTLLNSFRTK